MINAEVIKDLKPQLNVTDVSGWSKQQWLEFRDGGLGCSEIGTAMDMNAFMEPGILFAQKSGMMATEPFDNNAMFMGRFFEEKVVTLWEHYDLDTPGWETTSYNVENGIKLREAFKPEVYVVNEDYPWLFGGPDGLFWHGDDLAVLEIKTISGQAARRYEEGIPPSYIYQIYGYMMLFDVQYAEIAMLVDGREFVVYPFDRNENICEYIDEYCSDFWKRVEKAKEFAPQMRMEADSKKYHEMQNQYTKLAPRVLGEDEREFNKYIDARYKYDPEGQPDHTRSTVYWVNMLQNWKDKEALAKKKIKAYSAKVKDFLGGDVRFSDDIDVKVTYTKDKNGRRVLRTKRIEGEK